MEFWKYYDGNKNDLLPEVIKHKNEKEIAMHNPKWAYQYAMDYGNFPEGEAVIAKSAKYSHRYAVYALKGPFKLGEPAIAKDEYYSKRYTQYALKKDFYLDGKLICKYKG